MRTSLLASVAALALALAAPALAQTPSNPLPANPSDVTNGNPSAGTPSGLPPGQDPGTNSHLTPSSANSQPSAQPDRGNSPIAGEGSTTTPAETAPGAPAQAAPESSAGGSAPPSGMSADQSDQAPKPAKKWHRMHHATADAGGSGHWAHEPGTGESGPASARASNIDSADTHSAIAPHLPTPAVGDNADPARYLHDAERALRSHRTGEAQQALEMAETRLLDRSTPAGNEKQTDQSPEIQQVASARRALASGDTAAASSAIHSALAGSPAASE
jgi:hypothetical protein